MALSKFVRFVATLCVESAAEATIQFPALALPMAKSKADKFAAVVFVAAT